MIKNIITLVLLTTTACLLKTEKIKAQPIVYHSSYDISLGLLDSLHAFDGKKYGKVAAYLQKKGFKLEHTPKIITDKELLKVHTAEYLQSLTASMNIAKIAEIPLLTLIPNFLLQAYVLNPMKYATGGTVLAVQLALEKGWAINLSGGYHHAKANKGEGFCFYADIPLAIKIILEKHPEFKVLIVDLDAHQGNGLEMVCGTDDILKDSVSIFDMYHKNIYPSDNVARQYITFDHPLSTREQKSTHQYLEILKLNLPQAISQVSPDLIIYNAGTDILTGDPLGGLNVSKDGILERDRFIFECARENHIPIAMVLSGGYTDQSAGIIGESIANIINNMTNQ